MGIFVAPFIHGNVFHLISNTFPLIFLGVGLFYFYHRIAWQVILAIYLISGFWVWLAARDAYHIGASGVIYGLIFFMLLSGFIRKNTRSSPTDDSWTRIQSAPTSTHEKVRTRK